MNEFLKRFFTSILIVIVTFYFIFSGSYLFGIFIALLFIFSFLEWLNLVSIKNIFLLVLGFIILAASCFAAFQLQRTNFDYFIFLILISISSDIGGYAFGKILGGPKLTKISPNKTYSGMVGSFIMSLLIGIIYIYNVETNSIFIKYNLSNFFVYFLIILICTINQLGDLSISFFKRIKGVNDTGNFLPGHGGLLDRIDGLIFSILIGWIIKKLFLI